MPPALVLQDLSKTYRSGPPWKRKEVEALKHVDLEVPEGGVFGLLGLNGAGKTTAVKILLGLLRPTTGGVEVLGGNVGDRRVRSQLGYLPELPYLARTLTASESLRYFGSLFGLAGRELARRVDEMLELVRLEKAAHRKVSEFSKGMQQRLGIGQGLIGRPRLFICDEPMSGLDPVGNREMREIFLDLKRGGTTVFMNTHILDEVERICDRIAVLHGGGLVAESSIADVLNTRNLVPYNLELPAGPPLRDWEMEGTRLEGGLLSIRGGDLQEVLARLGKAGVKPISIRPQSSVVETYFLKAIGREDAAHPPGRALS